MSSKEMFQDVPTVELKRRRKELKKEIEEAYKHADILRTAYNLMADALHQRCFPHSWDKHQKQGRGGLIKKMYTETWYKCSKCGFKTDSVIEEEYD